MTIFTFLVYFCYLVFQLFSHKNLYDDHHSDVQESVAYPSKIAKMLHARTSVERKTPPAPSPPPTNGEMDHGPQDAEAGLEEEEEEKPAMGVQTTIILLIVVTVVCRWLTSLAVPRSNRAK